MSWVPRASESGWRNQPVPKGWETYWSLKEMKQVWRKVGSGRR